LSGAFDIVVHQGAHSNCSTHLRVAAAESGAIPVSVFVVASAAAVRRAHHFKTHLCAACSLSSADKNRVKISLTHLWLRNGNACGRSASIARQAKNAQVFVRE